MMKIKDLKAGMVVYEQAGRAAIRMAVTSDAVHELRKGCVMGWHCDAKDDDGHDIHLYSADGLEHYGPRLYSEPAYYQTKY